MSPIFIEPIHLYMTKIIIILIIIYQYSLSYFIGRHCRFTPTCSQYAIESLKKYGLLKGGKLAIKRISQCHPWGKSGIDNVP